MSEKNKAKILPQTIEEEITQSYIDYSMSVIVSRALPDVRDWLKPVLRRILYAMYDLKLFHNASFKKSAAVVWEVLWKYHPHWDSSVYEAMVRMTQDFSLRYPLVEWQGNFWSIDWDWAAAMRYTEARLTKIASEMLQDLEMETVDWRDNYDNSRQEPIVLPSKFPNHLCNWTMWIAVWMATNMAPHNLNEVIDSSLLLIQNPDTSIDEIMKIIKWPDFPTWWYIYDSESIKEVYKKWKWWIKCRGKAEITEIDWKKSILISQLPYQVNKANLVSKIWELVNQKKIEWITDITDESGKEKIKIVITIKKWSNPNDVLTLIYKYTDLQTNFNLNNVILIEKWIQPHTLNIKELLEEFVSFRREVVYRRSIFLLNKAKDRLHILLWLQKAIDILDEVIATIRWSQTRQDAKNELMKKYEFTDSQAEYILMLRLQTLVWLEIEKILNEIDDKRSLIEYLENIINNPKKLDEVVSEELVYVKNEYWDKRRTILSESLEVYQLEDSVKNLKRLEELQKEDIILWMWDDFETKILYQKRLNIIPENTISIKYIHNQYKIFAITDKWELIIRRIKDMWVYNIKNPWINFKKQFKLKWEIVFVDIIDEDFDHIVMLTNKNNIKKVSKKVVDKLKKTPTKIMHLADNENICKVCKTSEKDNILILSDSWIILMFNESNIRASGKVSWWVKAMSLEENEKVADMFLNSWEPFMFLYSQNAGKLISLEDMKIQKRWQRWLIGTKLSKWEKLLGWISIDEWAVTLKLKTWKLVEIHSNNIKLKERDKKMSKISEKEIISIFRPWKENNEQ